MCATDWEHQSKPSKCICITMAKQYWSLLKRKQPHSWVYFEGYRKQLVKTNVETTDNITFTSYQKLIFSRYINNNIIPVASLL